MKCGSGLFKQRICFVQCKLVSPILDNDIQYHEGPYDEENKFTSCSNIYFFFAMYHDLWSLHFPAKQHHRSMTSDAMRTANEKRPTPEAMSLQSCRNICSTTSR